MAGQEACGEIEQAKVTHCSRRRGVGNDEQSLVLLENGVLECAVEHPIRRVRMLGARTTLAR